MNNAPYYIKDNKTFMRLDNGGERELSNFNTRIETLEQIDDGQSVRQYVQTHSRIAGQSKDIVSLIPIERFQAMTWVIEYLGPEARIAVGNTNKDHLKNAIQTLSTTEREIPRKRKYSHLGWREIDGVWNFLHSGGAIGPDGLNPTIKVTFNEDPTFRNFRFHAPSLESLPEDFKSALQLLKLPEGIGHMIIGFALLSAVNPALKADFAFWFIGHTGTFKSCLTALCAAFFGRGFNERALPVGWKSTANALERSAFLAKDVVFVIDDWKPSGDRFADLKLNEVADRLVRGLGNQNGRTRLDSNSELKVTYYPRCALLASGEDMPHGTSLRARSLFLEMKPNLISSQTLKDHQTDARQGRYANLMACYLKWLAPRLEALSTDSADALELARASLLMPHPRITDSVAKLCLAVEHFFVFASDHHLISTQEREVLQTEFRSIFAIIGQCQSEFQIDDDPCQVFLKTLKAALTGGQAHIAMATKGFGIPFPHEPYGWRGESTAHYAQGPKLGWLSQDSKEIWLSPELAYQAVSRFGRNLPLTQTTLGKRLKEKGLLIATDVEHNAVSRVVEGAKQKVWVLRNFVDPDAV